MNAVSFALTRRVVSCLAVALMALVLITAAARATTIERVVSEGGIEAWLVREPAVPMIAVDFAFVGGAAQDVAGKAGTAYLVA
ncbi:MAG TPA: insulinase family protein, partial [Xanthobacteraceae bacterium]|nr:insulinase family protein [Xanthobacteraceae bacterium]